MRFSLIIICICLFSCSEKKEAEKKISSSKNTTVIPPGQGHVSNPENSDQTDYTAMQTEIDFKTKDGLRVSAYISEIDEKAPYFLLCHQAGFGKSEYTETQAWLNSIGFNTLAIDQRSGGNVDGVKNMTAIRAKEKSLPQSYLDAEQDIRAAIDHLIILVAGTENPVYLMGSSYSASLVLKIAADTSYEHHERISAVVSYSPGEYFDTYQLEPDLRLIECPVYLSASKNEISDIKELAEAIESYVHIYVPEYESVHGSRALWPNFKGYEKRREDLRDFLKEINKK